MVILSADLLLWLNAVTDDTIHEEIELEKGNGVESSNATSSEADASLFSGMGKCVSKSDVLCCL